MSKKQKKKCYAIHFIDEKRDEIVFSWSECQEKMKGHNNMFKGFMTELDAEEWLKGITTDKEKAHNRQVDAHREEKKVRKKQIASLKKYSFILDEEHAKALDEWLAQRNVKLSDYMKEIVELDMMG